MLLPVIRLLFSPMWHPAAAEVSHLQKSTRWTSEDAAAAKQRAAYAKLKAQVDAAQGRLVPASNHTIISTQSKKGAGGQLLILSQAPEKVLLPSPHVLSAAIDLDFSPTADVSLLAGSAIELGLAAAQIDTREISRSQAAKLARRQVIREERRRRGEALKQMEKFKLNSSQLSPSSQHFLLPAGVPVAAAAAAVAVTASSAASSSSVPSLFSLASGISSFPSAPLTSLGDFASVARSMPTSGRKIIYQNRFRDRVNLTLGRREDDSSAAGWEEAEESLRKANRRTPVTMPRNGVVWNSLS
jgi:hypothetical protein